MQTTTLGKIYRAVLGTTFTSALLCNTSAQAVDFDAEHFVQEKCTRCHTDSVYSRPDRRMKSMDQLEAQVRRCDANVGTTLFDEEISAVVKFLDDQYYQFEK